MSWNSRHVGRYGLLQDKKLVWFASKLNFPGFQVNRVTHSTHDCCVDYWRCVDSLLDRTQMDTMELLYSGLGLRVCNTTENIKLSDSIFTHFWLTFVYITDFNDTRSLVLPGPPPVNLDCADLLYATVAQIGPIGLSKDTGLGSTSQINDTPMTFLDLMYMPIRENTSANMLISYKLILLLFFHSRF